MSWEHVELRNLLSFITSGSRGWAKYYRDSGSLFLRIQNVGRNELRLDDTAFVAPPDTPEARRTRVQPGDVLLSITADLGRTAVVPEGIGPAHINQHLAILRTEGIEPSFLASYLALGPGRYQFKRLDRLGVKSGLNFDDIRGLRIPLPPLAEQKRIAAILDKADAVRRKRQESIRLTEDFLRATFLDMFGDPVTNPKGWPVHRLGGIAKLDRGRSRNRPRDLPELYGGPYPFIQTGDVANSRGRITSYTQTYSEKGLAQSKLWSAGTLVITIAANIGHTAVLTFDACFPDSMVGLIPGDDLKVEFGHFWFGAMRQRIEDAATQVAQKNINLKMLRGLEVALPPLEAQERFAEIVERNRGVEDSHEDSKQQLGHLFNSLVQRAFRGEL